MKRILLSALFVAACSGDGPLVPGDDQGRVAYVVPGAEPMLFIQNADGSSRFRVRFDGAEDRIPGNYPADLLPVTDAQIRAIGPVKWSPDGQRLAVVLTLAYDQSQVVVVDAQGRNARTASINSQIILSDIAWSRDGTRLAYTMSTLPHALGIDVFYTDLTTDRVHRVTTDEALGIAGVELAWSRDRHTLYWTRISGEQQDDVSNALTAVYAFNLETGARRIVANGLLGRATGLAEDAEFALLVRNDGWDGSDYRRALVQIPLRGGNDHLVVAPGSVQFAELTSGQCHAVVAFGGVHGRFELVALATGTADPLLATGSEPTAIDAYFEHEDCP